MEWTSERKKKIAMVRYTAATGTTARNDERQLTLGLGESVKRVARSQETK